MRQQQSLSGTWQFSTDPQGTLTANDVRYDRDIPVPMPWQAVFPDLQSYSGYAWYRRQVTLDDDWLKGELLLHFGAVDYWCQVYVNGQLAGEHEGGYTPFTIQAKRFFHAGDNEIVVRVYDSAQEGIFIPRWPDEQYRPAHPGPPFNAENVPHGKQEWYINAGGIWQDVTLTAVPAAWISNVHATTDIHSGEVRFDIEVEGSAQGTLRVSVEPGGAQPAGVDLKPGQGSYSLTVKVDSPALWDLGSPNLYTAKITLGAGDNSDETQVRFGFREITTQDGKLLLNGEPLYLICALDQDLYPDTIYTVPSREYLRDEFQKALDMGLNCLRCHIKPPDPVYLELADEMGLLVWAEIPSWRTFYIKGTQHERQRDLSDVVKGRVEQTLREMVRRDFNHPSIVIWTIVNEDWGTSLPLSAADRQWVSAMYDVCKKLDPTRLVVDNSPCPHPWGPNIHVKSDLDDFHVYANIPDQAHQFERTIEQINMRPLWTYSSYGDSERTGGEPLILSEFGNWGLPSLRKLQEQYDGRDPHWFTTGPWWSSWEGEAGWPSGVEERFNALGLDKVWGSYEQFAEATQWHQFEALKFQIEHMRRQSAIQGYVITELADIYWESNGLLDFYRNPKVFSGDIRHVNALDTLSLCPEAWALWSDEKLKVTLFGSHYSRESWAGARLRWQLKGGASGEREVREAARGTVSSLGSVKLALPDAGEAQALDVRFTLEAGGKELARSGANLLVLPTSIRRATLEEPIGIITSDDIGEEDVPEALARPPEGVEGIDPSLEAINQPDEASLPMRPGANLRKALTRLGYNVAGKLSEGVRTAVTNYATPELLRWVREGGDLLFISEGPSPFFWVQPRGGAYSGSWLTSFTWVRPDVHTRLKVSNPLGMPYMSVMPRGTILGLPLEDRHIQPDILAGMVSGWVGHPAAHTIQFRYGKGRVVMTTFALATALPNDPVAVAMFHDLLEYLRSDRCDPVLRGNY